MPNSSTKKLAELVDALVERTRKKEVNWEVAGEGIYKTDLSGYNVILSKYKGPRATLPDFIINLFNTVGQVVEKFDDTDLSDHKPERYDGYYEAMEDLYATVAGQATGANEAVDQILDALTRRQ